MSSRDDKRRSWVVFAILFASFAYFYQGVGPNQNSRFDLVRAMVDRHTFQIDAYEKNTIDKAEANGHAYSDKAPGLAFASAPVYLVVRIFQGFATPSRDSARAALYVITIVVLGGASAAGAAYAYLFQRRLGIGTVPALLAVFAYALGSNHFAYATLFVSHAFIAALFVVAFGLVHGTRPDRARVLAIAGFLCSWATISEYPAGVLAAFVAVYVWRRHGARALIPFGAAAAAPLLLLAAYNTSCFGSPFSIGYGHLSTERYRTATESGFFGVSVPSLEAMGRLLFSEQRGIIPLAPWIVLVVPGMVLLFRDRERRREALLAAGCITFPFLVASGYAIWDAGMAMGPRYFVVALPFCAIATGLALEALAHLPRPGRVPLATLAGCAIVYSLVVCSACVAVMPEFVDAPIPLRVSDMREPDIEHPLTTFVLPLIVRGYVSVKGTTPTGQIGYAIGFEGHEDDANNLGERLGLHGLTSLVPLLVLWAIGVAALIRSIVRERQRSSR